VRIYVLLRLLLHLGHPTHHTCRDRQTSAVHAVDTQSALALRGRCNQLWGPPPLNGWSWHGFHTYSMMAITSLELTTCHW